MSVGLMLPSYLDPDERLSLAETADDLGVDAVFVGESASSNVFIDLARIAAQTSSVELGAGIANVFSRSPSLIALSAAQLDTLSNGRVILGLGASTPPLIEGLDGIPIAVAALGPANRRLTGAKADIWLPQLVPKRVFDESETDVYDAARDAGRTRDDIDVYAYVPTAIDEDADEAYNRVRKHIATYAGSAQPYRDAIVDAGYDVAAEVYRTWQDGDRDDAVELIPDELVEDIGLVGTPDDAPAARSRWLEAGADGVVMNFPPGTSGDEVRTALAAVS